MADEIYERDGDLFIPGKWAGGPWSADFQHGGPIAGLFAQTAETAASENDLQLVRLTTELFRTVPIAPLALETRYVRRGYRIAGLEMNLRLPDETDVMCRATALLMRSTPGASPGWKTAEQRPPDPGGLDPAKFVPEEFSKHLPVGFHLSVRACVGSDDHGGYAWLATPLDIVAGIPATSLQRFAALSDISFGMSTRLRHLLEPEARPLQPMINADSTLYWERLPVGEWLGLRSLLLTDRAGIGVSDVALYDVEGRFGRCLQAEMLNPRPRYA